MTLSKSLYVDEDERVAGDRLASDLIAACRLAGASGAAALPPSPIGRADAPSSNGDRTAHDIAMRFRNASSKFSGNEGEAWMEYVTENPPVARD